MALANQAALLDELMGAYRNNTDSKVMFWNEDIVCKYYLAGFCPHELFANTKEQIGPCPNHHDQNLLAKYKESSRYQRMGYEKQLQTYLARFIDRRDARIVINRERIKETPINGQEAKLLEIIEKHKSDIGEMINQIESLANDGKVAESQQLFTQLEDKKNILKYDEFELEKQKLVSKIKEDDVCDICGAIVNKNDSRNSADNHENGRIHCGYMKINEVLLGLNDLVIKIESRDNGDDSTERKDKKRKHGDRKRSRSRSRSKKRRKHSRERSDDRHRSSNKHRSRRS